MLNFAKDNASLYKSPRGYAAMMRTYDAQLARWPVPYESRSVPTRYGRTHALVSGPEDAPPLVLMHGLAANALVWKPNITVLSRRFRVYALDTIGEAGRSAPTRPSLIGPAYANWLVDTFDGLGLDQPDIMGISFGGWITLKLAIHAPDRIGRAIALCPAGFVPIKLGFVPMAIGASLFPNPATLDTLARTLCAPSVRMSDEDRELLTISMSHHRPKIVPVLPFSEWELKRIVAPVLLLVGKHECIYNAAHMVNRARRCLPDVTASIVAGAGHALNSDQPDVLHEHVLNFLTSTESVTSVSYK